MLEKVGLPPKPSLRGNNWVVDASHCQGCSSQFTFLNRKHHCRRCGGLFCGSCTQQRIVLRGQGDSPVRICDPCKKLEDAARFELRHGHKNRGGKGSSKLASRSVDEVLNQIMADDGKESVPVGSGKEIPDQDEDEDLLGNSSNDKSDGIHSEVESNSPEELRNQALDEKNKYKILKGQGKSTEALKAFKRAKELERQATALELQLRKSRRKALASSSKAETQKSDDFDKPFIQKGKEKDDLTSELKELGWSDVDIHASEKKPATLSLEGELLNLIQREDSTKTSYSKASSGVDKTQVIAMKKKALMLKREGKLAEAKEELKKAKILEKQLEEQEFLAEAEDSDDELSALIRSLDNDKQKDSSIGLNPDLGFDMDNLLGHGGDLGIDVNFEVTDDDMHDPDIAAALESFGWTEEESFQPNENVAQPTHFDREALEEEILKLKKEAVSQKRSGNMSEAMSLLKKAKVLEKDLDSLDLVDSVVSERATTADIVSNIDRKPKPKSRLMIQKELLALKKKALALRREGKLDEADEELKKGKFLEEQLEEMDNNATKMDTPVNVGYEVSEPEVNHLDLSSVLATNDEEGHVTDTDLHDPTYLSLLKNLGWQDEDNITAISSVEVSKKKPEISLEHVRKPRSKSEIQRELLVLKRKALALRRQGQESEAEEVLATAKELEEQLAEIEAPKKAEVEVSKQENVDVIPEPMEKGTAQTPRKRPAEADDDSEKQNLSPSVSPENQKSPIQQEILAHKKKALALKREGKLAEARDELRKAKLLERSLVEDKPENPPGPISMEVSPPAVSSTVHEDCDPPQLAQKPMSSHDRFKLQRECLNHKRNALKLRREGRTEEAEAELESAKKIEAQLEEVSPHEPTTLASSEVGPTEDVGVEDLLDPQLLSALKSIGLQDIHVISHAPGNTQLSSSSSIKNNNSNQERLQLEVQIKEEKMKALNLKRSGKQAEALDALRRAKNMEKKLNLLPS